MSDALARLPKVELHLHLEGAIPLPALWTLIEKYGGASEIGGLAALEERFRYRNFPQFIETWVWKNQFIREYDDFTYFAEKVAQDLARQNIRYAEAFYSPGDFFRRGLEVQRITEAVRKGLDRHRNTIRIALIADLIRDFGPEKGMRWLRQVHEVRELGVIGIGLGGSEQNVPPEVYKQVYARARQLGFHTTAHAGEAAGPASIWGALNVLGVERIGHGTRAVEDAALLQVLRDKRIPIEVCPLSNVRTGVVHDLGAHPVRRFWKEGLLISINTDDPKMFQTSLQLEYLSLMEVLDFSPADVARLVEMAVESAWCDAQTKKKLREELASFTA